MNRERGPNWWLRPRRFVYPKGRRSRYGLRWHSATRRPLLFWAEMGGWCLFTIGQQDDGRYFGRVVDKTATKRPETMPDFETIEEAKTWLSQRAEELCIWHKNRQEGRSVA